MNFKRSIISVSVACALLLPGSTIFAGETDDIPPGLQRPAVAALPALSLSTTMSTTESDRYATEALRLLGDGKLEDASAKIAEALRLRMDRSYYHLINGLVYHLQARQGKKASFDLADQGYQLAIKFDDSNWLAYYYAGLLALDMSNFTRASQFLSEALMYRADDPGVLRAMAYSAYRSGRPDVAAGAIDTLEKKQPLRSPSELRNAAVIMAAVGQDERARGYLRQLGASGEPMADYIGRRLQDWNDVRGRFFKTQLDPAVPVAPADGGLGAAGLAPGLGAGGLPGDPGTPGMSTDPNSIGGIGGIGGIPGAFPPPPPKTAPGTENRMVVVDVVMISTEETFLTAKGVNLLNGLSLQFSETSSKFTRSVDHAGSVTSTGTITRAIGIPSITYTLNILNSNNARSEILARPTLVARAGKTSQFFSGEELNAVAVSTGTVGGAPINIQRNIGVNLKMTPILLEDGRISMDIAAERTFLKAPSQDVAFTFKVQFTKSKIDANVVMRFGETLILGGLSEKEAQTTRDGVPLLQDVPMLQYLFSRAETNDFQKSVLILITPRPPQYVYQPDKARQEYEKSLSEDERPLANLRARYGDWFKPYPNWASVFHQLQGNSLYREFRTGDVALENWADYRTLHDRLKQVREFLYY